jgi:hypothetical protein
MGGIERAGVRAADSQTIAERQMIEIEFIVRPPRPLKSVM